MNRDIQSVDDDIIRKKRLIEHILCSDKDIVEVLDNPTIDPECPEDLVYENIWPCIRIPGTQDISKNFITFTVDDTERMPSNEVMKRQTIQFVIFVHKDHIKTKYGMARHDLLGYLIRDNFNWTNEFGLQFKLIYNKESTIDGDYYCRTLKFEATKVNHLNNAKKANPNGKFRY